MIYNKRVEDTKSMEYLNINAFARYMRVSPSYISKIKNNKVVVSEKMYEKLITLLTEFRNNSNM